MCEITKNRLQFFSLFLTAILSLLTRAVVFVCVAIFCRTKNSDIRSNDCLWSGIAVDINEVLSSEALKTELDVTVA